ncbi:glycosyltransferase family 9 protein [Hanstruepera ponticola]|uniref:glycosyltransferase family 9 protein n=1 Tax=Hanstruepera ponticola TaxID=2042995 RepID=UPI001782DA2B|nr:glycosyltransferase family 9 protein [Hanstruepera ponticola]
MKILVIQQKMIGDVLTSSILFEALREKYPNAKLDYLINTHTYPVVENNPFVDNFVFLTRTEENSKIALYKFAKHIKNLNYDVVIDVYSKISSNLITHLSGAKTKISYHKWYSAYIYHFNIKRLTTTNLDCGLAIVNRMQLLEPLKISFKEIKPKIYLTNHELENSKSFLLNNGIDFNKPLFMISVLGSGHNKTYPFDYMAQVIDQIAETTNGQILFNYIPNQETDAKAIYEKCKLTTRKLIYFDVFGKSLREFLALTAHCDAVIGNEGGATNMAKALQVKTFTIFSPWIDKDTWNLFEEKGFHESVHLKDFEPKTYINKSEKALKPQAEKLYTKFKPAFFKEQLNVFLKQTN